MMKHLLCIVTNPRRAEMRIKVCQIEKLIIDGKNAGYAAELLPVDLSKIKEGDEVWVKAKVLTVNVDLMEIGRSGVVNKKDCIAHFPAPEPAKYCEGKEPNGDYYCSTCKKWIKSPTKPGRGEIEKLDDKIFYRIGVRKMKMISETTKEKVMEYLNNVIPGDPPMMYRYMFPIGIYLQ